LYASIIYPRSHRDNVRDSHEKRCGEFYAPGSHVYKSRKGKTSLERIVGKENFFLSILPSFETSSPPS